MKQQIRQFSTVKTGYSFRTRLEPTENGSVFVIQMKDLLSNNTVNCTELARIDVDFVKKHPFAKEGDLIFRSRGKSSTTAIITENPGKAIVAAPLLKVRITKPELVLPEYLNWYISQREAQSFLASRAKNTAQKVVSKRDLEDMDVFLPDMRTQELIVESAALANKESLILNQLTEKRNQKLSALLMNLAKGE